MSYGTGLGLYPYGESGTASENEEVSSTYEGRHLTVLGTEITSHMDGHTLQQSKHPMVVRENIVGVAFTTETATGTGLYVAFDTEGLFKLAVVAIAGTAVIPGDELYIHKTTAIITNDPNKNLYAHFGYALGGVTAGNTAIITVKVHWDPDDAEEKVGVSGTPFVSSLVSHHFRDYYYEATGGSYIQGMGMHLNIPNDAARTYVVHTMVLGVTIPADAWIVTGLGNVLELTMEVTAGDEAMCQHAILNLHYSSLQTNPTTNSSPCYIRLEDEHEDNDTSCMRSLFHFADHTTLPEGGATVGWQVIQDCNAAKTHDVSIRCTYGPGATPIWLMATTSAPD